MPRECWPSQWWDLSRREEMERVIKAAGEGMGMGAGSRGPGLDVCLRRHFLCLQGGL